MKEGHCVQSNRRLGVGGQPPQYPTRVRITPEAAAWSRHDEETSQRHKMQDGGEDWQTWSGEE